MPISRRSAIVWGAAAAAAALWPRRGMAQATADWSHGMSGFGELKYAAGFQRFDYVDPAAPKAGAVALQISSTTGNQAFDTFNTLNIFVLKGDGAAGMPLTFDSLMARALDEPDAMYGLVAEAVRAAPDGLSHSWRIRPQARFSDGSPLTAEDVAFSIMLLKQKGHPAFSQALRFVAGAEVTEAGVVTVRYDRGRSRNLPLLVAGLPIFSKPYYTARPFEESTLEAPLGSGAYKVGRFEQGRFIEFTRNPDYWGRDLPVNVGVNNFDRIRYEYYRDRQVALEGFKAGSFTFREEFTSRDWANSYDFPAVREGRVKRETIPDETPSGTQGWWFNTRREQFADRRVRDGLNYLFDFEWTNVNLMFRSYQRTTSFFENSDMKAAGKPSPEELKLLEPWRGKVPDEVFGDPFVPPASDGSGQDRNLLRRADTLLREAGCRREGNVMRLPSGKPFEIEFLDFSGALEPHTSTLIKNMKLIGIEARYRVVDAAQYQRRVDAFDFDVITRRTSMGMTPDEGLRTMFGSRTATVEGSSNIAGVRDPAVDALIDAALTSATRAELVTACRALDRVLRAGRYWIPMWFKAEHWLAYWDMFGRPPVKPRYDRGAPATWWYDEAKAKRIGKA
ncbi:extracellular solute-binding protein [Alsobacter sp. R-9]